MADRLSEAELQDLKGRNPCDVWAGKWVALRRKGKGFIGPCPIHSVNAQAADSTSFECNAEGWVCATCADGGDVIKLVMLREGLSFHAAIERLGGTRQVDAAEAERAEKWRAEERARRDRESRDYREKERRRLWEMFKPAPAIAGTPAEAMLRFRGLAAPVTSPPRLRFLKYCPMYVDGSARAQPVHKGPAMLAAIVDAGGRFCGLHITWIDLEKPKGKASIAHPGSGEILPAKKVRGSKAGGRIELVPRLAPRRLVIGEGIETVLAVSTALERAGWDLAETAFWSSVDLGNMGGKATATVAHPFLKTQNKRAQRVPGPVPDLDAPGLPIPDSVEEIILLGDGDSDRFLTECAIARAAARFAREGRVIRAAWAPAGQDFNDVILASPEGTAEVVRLVEAAKPPIVPADVAPESNGARKRVRSSSLPARPESTPAQPPAPSEDPAPPDDAARSPAARPPGAESASSQMGGSKTEDGRRGAGVCATERRFGPGGDLTPQQKEKLDLRLAYFPHTDLGNAERFRERFRGKLLWCPAVGWLWWDGRRWSRDGADGKVKIAAHYVARAIQDEADTLAQSEEDAVVRVKNAGKENEEQIFRSDLLRSWGRETESNAKLGAIANQAPPFLEVTPDQLDADPFKINVANGTLVCRPTTDGTDFITFKPHDPTDLITKLSPVLYDRAADCPLYDQFLAEVQPNADVRRFLHQWKGVSLTGDVTEQRLCLFYGKGKNGKSVFEDATAHVAGDFSETVPIETFLHEGRGRNAGQATPDLAILPGVRMLRTSEPEKNAKLAEALIKLATGGEPIIARHLNKDYFKFYPQFKLTISGNHRPEIKGTDEGIWRRVILVPWTYTVPKPKQDKKLGAKLRWEASGILNRLLDGLRDWMENGLIVPADVDIATQEYRRDSDPLGRFLAACVEEDPKQRVQSSILHELFCAWARVNGASEWSNKGFTAAMKERGYQADKSSSMFWMGLRAVKTVEDFAPASARPPDRSAERDDVIPL